MITNAVKKTKPCQSFMPLLLQFHYKKKLVYKPQFLIKKKKKVRIRS